MSAIAKTKLCKKISYSILVCGCEEIINDGNMEKNKTGDHKSINDDALANFRKQPIDKREKKEKRRTNKYNNYFLFTC